MAAGQYKMELAKQAEELKYATSKMEEYVRRTSQLESENKRLLQAVREVSVSVGPEQLDAMCRQLVAEEMKCGKLEVEVQFLWEQLKHEEARCREVEVAPLVAKLEVAMAQLAELEGINRRQSVALADCFKAMEEQTNVAARATEGRAKMAAKSKEDRAKMATMEEQLAKMAAKVKEEEAKMADSCRAELGRLALEVRCTRAILEESQSQNRRLEEEKAAVCNELTRLRGQHQLAQGEVDRLRELHQLAQGEVDLLQHTLQGEVEGLRLQYHAAQGEMEGLRQQYHAAQGEMEGLRQQCSAAQGEVGSLNTAMALKERECGELEKKCKTLEAQVVGLWKSNDEKNSQLVAMTTRLQKFDQVAENTMRVLRNSSELANGLQHMNELEAQVEALLNDKDVLEQLVERLVEEKAGLVRTCYILRDELTTKMDKRSVWDNVMKCPQELQEEMEFCKSQLEVFKQDFAKQRKEYENIYTKWNQLREDVRAKDSACVAEVDGLKATITRLLNASNGKERDLAVAKAVMSQQKEGLRSREQELARCRKQIEGYRETVKSFEDAARADGGCKSQAVKGAHPVATTWLQRTV